MPRFWNSLIPGLLLLAGGAHTVIASDHVPAPAKSVTVAIPTSLAAAAPPPAVLGSDSHPPASQTTRAVQIGRTGSVTARATAVMAAPRKTALAQRIRAFLEQPRFKDAMWGVDVEDLRNGRTLYAHNARKLFILASNTKLFTASLALAKLGPNYRMDTSLYATARPSGDGVLRGDLLLYGRGDPSLGRRIEGYSSADWAQRLAEALVTQGIRSIHGNLIVDDTYFQGPPITPGWEAEDLQSAFAPSPTALNVQGNVFHLTVSRHGHRCCKVTATPAAAGIHIINLTRQDADNGGNGLGIYRPPGTHRVYVYDHLRAGIRNRKFLLSVPDPALMAGKLLRAAIVSKGIRLHGTVRAVHWPETDPLLSNPHLRRVARITSPPLRILVHHMLKQSDNLYAQLLLLQVGVQTAQTGLCSDRPRRPVNSNEWGLCAMRAFLRHIGIPASEANFDEGSGLSRKDVVAPAAMVSLLDWVRKQPFATVFDKALPVAGVDGTLQWRMRGSAAMDNLHAKTGTLAYAYTLAGYVTDASGRTLAFSLMLNNYLRHMDSQGIPVDPRPTQDLDALADMLADARSIPAAPSVQTFQRQEVGVTTTSVKPVPVGLNPAAISPDPGESGSPLRTQINNLCLPHHLRHVAGPASFYSARQLPRVVHGDLRVPGNDYCDTPPGPAEHCRQRSSYPVLRRPGARPATGGKHPG